MIKSNRDEDWAGYYDVYEVDFRDTYKTHAKPQNDSHFVMLQHNLRNYMNNRKVFAEIGFGAGLTLRKASNYFDKVYGLDISPQNVELTKKELKEEGYNNIHLFVSDIMEKDEIFKNKFDIISFIHGIEHFSTADYPKFFDNIRYYLRPRGVFTGALPNNLSFNYRMCPKCKNIFEIDGHLSVHTIDSLKQLFYDYSFEILYLSDINLHYYWKSKATLKTIYRFVIHKILKTPSKMQLEFIVRPRFYQYDQS